MLEMKNYLKDALKMDDSFVEELNRCREYPEEDIVKKRNFKYFL